MKNIILAYFLPLSRDNTWSLELFVGFAEKYATRALCMSVLLMLGATITKTMGEMWLYYGLLTSGGVFGLLFGIYASATFDSRIR